MINLFNSRQPWSPEGRNLLNSEGWEGYNGELDYRPERDGPAASVPLPVRYEDQHTSPVYYALGQDNAMPVFKPGEVSSDPEPWTPTRGRQELAPAEPQRSEEDVQAAYENGLQEIRPFVSIGGKESLPYVKSMFGRGLGEIADIARTQYPGASVRTGVTGRPIITMPPDATQWRPTPSPSWGDVGPEFAMEEVPIGGQEFQLDAPGVTLRDVANGGGQTVYKVGNALWQSRTGTKAATNLFGPIGAIPGAVIGAAKGYFEADRAIDEYARKFKGRP